MGMTIGNSDISALYIGNSKVVSIYFGTVPIYSSETDPYLLDANGNIIEDSTGEEILINGEEAYESEYTYNEIDGFITNVIGGS